MLELEGIFRKAGLAHHQRHDIEGGIQQARFREAAQADDGHVAIGAGVQICPDAVQSFGDLIRVKLAGPLIEQAVGQLGQPAVRAVAGAAGIEHHANVDDGQFWAGNEIYPRAVGRGPVLDLGIGSGGAARNQTEHGETNRQ